MPVTDIVMFSRDGCNPCNDMQKVLTTLCDENNIALSVRKINAESPEIDQFNIRAVPSTILFKDDVPVQQLQGMQSLEFMRVVIKSLRG